MTFLRAHFRLPSIAALLVAVLLAGCAAEGQKQNVSRVRVFNAVLNSPAVSVSIADKTLASGLTYGQSSAYVETPSGSTVFTIKDAAGTVLASATYTLGNERPATLVVSGLPGNYGGLLFDDQVNPPQDGRVRVRFMHAASTVTPLDAYLNKPGEDIANVNPVYAATLGLYTNFAEISADTYILRLTLSGTKEVVYESDPIAMGSREAISLMAYSSGSQRMVTAARLMHDAGGSISLLPSKVARVRVANAVAGTPIDVLVDGTSRSTNAAVAALSDGIVLNAGNRIIRVDPNATAGTALVSGTFNFAPARDYTVLAMGSGTSATLAQFLDETQSANATTRIRLRVINGIVGGEPVDLLAGTTVVSTAAPGAAGSYGEVEAGTFTLAAKGKSSGTTYFSVADRAFTAADYNLRYVMLLTGTPGSVVAQLVVE